MLNLLELGAMDKGIVFTAFNNQTVDYQLIVEANSCGIKRLVNLPITVITDTPWESKYVDNFVVADPGIATTRHDQILSTTSWLNQNRYQVYELSPYKQTLLLDADFFIQNRSIFDVFNSDSDFLIVQHSVDVLTSKLVEPRYISSVAPGVVYATAVYFCKSDISEKIFQRAGEIKDNWDYYQTLYQYNSKFRNDFAFAFALHELNSGAPNNEFYMKLVVYNLMPSQTMEYRADIPWAMYKDFDSSRVNVMAMNLHILDKPIAEHHARWVLKNA